MKTPKSSTRAARIGCPLFSSCTHNLSFHPSVWFPSVPADLSLRRPSRSTKPQSPWRPSSVSRRRRRSFSSDQNTPTLTRTHPLTPPAPEWPAWLEAAGRICFWRKSRCVYLKIQTSLTTFRQFLHLTSEYDFIWLKSSEPVEFVCFLPHVPLITHKASFHFLMKHGKVLRSHIKLKSKQEPHSCCCHKRCVMLQFMSLSSENKSDNTTD